MDYNRVACGGTFDHLHKGHKAFLHFAFSRGKKVLIGIATDTFVKKSKKKGRVASYQDRKKMLEAFLKEEQLFQRAEIVPLDDMYGPTLHTSCPIDALVVTDETKTGAEKINEKRRVNNLPVLPVLCMKMIAENNFIVSSSRIRQGIMDKNGSLFVRKEYFSHSYFLPQCLRDMMHKPFGDMVSNDISAIEQLDPKQIVAIGDVTTFRFNLKNIQQKISVVDFVIERKKSFQTFEQLGFTGTEEIISITNPPGMITSSTWNGVKRILEHLHNQKRFILAVSGEEDLVFIPLLLALPLGFQLFYGQPHEGLVRVDVTMENKERMQALFKQFISSTTRGY